MDSFETPVGRNPDGSVAFSGDTRRNMASVTFYKREIRNHFKSEQAGAPIFDAVDYVKILQPGDLSTEVDKAVEPFDKHQFAQQWAQYKADQEQIPSGTPLIHLFPHQPDVVATLKHFKFYTVEQLAEASDTSMQSVPMGGYEYREKAKKFQEFSKDASKFLQIEKQLSDKDARITQLEKTVADLAAARDEEPRNKGGRPRRVHIPDEE